MATPSSTFTEMVLSTNRSWSKGVTDNVSENNALLHRMKKKGNIETRGGGREIDVRLAYAENSTYQRYSGFEQLDTGSSDEFTAATFPWQQVALHIVSSGRELRLNAGKEAMINLVKEKKKNAIRTAENQFAIDVYSDGTLSNQINGLANLIQTDGNGTVGGIDASTWTFWQNQYKEMTGTNLAATPNATNAASMKADMNSLWLSLVRGKDKPDVIVMTHDLYTLYETGEQQLQRYASSELAQAGFASLKYKSADVIFDDNSNFGTTDEKAYFINTDYMKLIQHKEAQWSMDEEKTPVNQDAVVIPTYWMGNMCLSNRSLQGVLFDAA